MLTMQFYINEKLIEKINVQNTGRKNTNGAYLYVITPITLLGWGGERTREVWHKEENGVIELGRKVLNELKRKNGGKNGQRKVKNNS